MIHNQVIADGALFRMSLEDGTTELLWTGLPVAGRFGWTIVDDTLYYIEPIGIDNTARVMPRNLFDGGEVSLYQGPMPLADTTMSVATATGERLFTRYQAASDDLVIFNVSDSGALRR